MFGDIVGKNRQDKEPKTDLNYIDGQIKELFDFTQNEAFNSRSQKGIDEISVKDNEYRMYDIMSIRLTIIKKFIEEIVGNYKKYLGVNNTSNASNAGKGGP